MSFSSHTETFYEFLTKTNSSIILSTYQAGKVVILRPVDGAVQAHFIAYNKPMGIAYRNGILSIGHKSRITNYLKRTKDLAKLADSSVELDSIFTEISSTVTGEIDIHEMCYDRDDNLFFLNTKYSCICAMDNIYSWNPVWRPSWITGYQGSDRCHLNGICTVDDKPKYVTALSETDTPQGWRDHKLDGGVIIDVNTHRVVTSGLSMPHSPRVHNGELYVLDSGNGYLVHVDKNTGEKTNLVELPGFGRGLDFYKNIAIVGISKIRETVSFGGLPISHRETARQAGVWLYDLTTNTEIGFLKFDSGVGEIFSVCLVDGGITDILNSDIHESYTTVLSVGEVLHPAAIKDFVKPQPGNTGQYFYQSALEKMAEDEVDQDEVDDLITRALSINAEHAGALIYRSKRLINESYPEQALVDLDAVLSQDSQNIEALLMSADCYLMLEQYDKTVEYLRRAIKYHPNPDNLKRRADAIQTKFLTP